MDPSWSQKSSLEKITTIALMFDYDQLNEDMKSAALQMMYDTLPAEQQALIATFLQNVENLQEQDLQDVFSQVR